MMNKKRGVSFFMAILLMVTLVNPAITSYASAESSTETIEVTEPQQTESSDRPEEESETVERLEEEQGSTTDSVIQSGPKLEETDKNSLAENPTNSLETDNPDSETQAAQTENPSEQETETNLESEPVITDQLQIINKEEAFVIGWQAAYEAEVLLNGENLTLQWQVSQDGENWSDIDGETETFYGFTVSEDMFSLWYRVCAYTESGTYASESAKPKEAVCYVEETGKARAAGDVEGYDSLAAAFGAYDDSNYSHDITIVLLKDVVIQSGITVGCPRNVASYKNTYTLKSSDGNHFTVYPEKYFNSTNSAMFYLDGDGGGSVGVIDGKSEVILQNVSIQGYAKDEEPIGSNQVDTIFDLDKDNTWLTIQGNVSLKNSGAGLVDVDEGNVDSITIESGNGNTASGWLTMQGEIKVPDSGKKMVIQGSDANFTNDSDIAFVSGSWSNGRWFANYTGQPSPTEAAYFRLKNPDNYWVVLDDTYAGDGSSGYGVIVSDKRPDVVYAGSLLADGTQQTDSYAKGILPGKNGNDTGESAVSSLATAFAKIRQLNNDEGDKKVNLAIVGGFEVSGDYTFSGTGFSGEGYEWTWKNEAEIWRYYRPTGKSSGDGGYSAENYDGALFKVSNGTVTLKNITVSGKESTDSSLTAQAPLYEVQSGGNLILEQAVLQNNQNGAENGKGGAVVLQNGGNLRAQNGSAIINNEIAATGKGTGVYVGAGSVLTLSGTYNTQNNQEIWLEDGETDGYFKVDGSLIVTGSDWIPLELDNYEDGRIIAEYVSGNADMNESEKFCPNEEKMLENSLYLAAQGNRLLLKKAEGGMNFGFTKVDKDEKPISGVTFRLYQCSQEDEEGQHNEFADIFGNEQENCWRQISQKTSPDSGKIVFGYLPDGEYRLAEVSGPYGYEIPEGQWKLTIDSTAQDSQEKVKLEYLVLSDEEAPETKVSINSDGNSTDMEQTFVHNRDAKLTEFVFHIKTSDSEKPMEGVQFRFYSCDYWKNPGHSHEELVSDEVIENGTCWEDYTRGSQEDNGIFVSDSNGNVNIGKLMDGDYMLQQISTLDGYSLPEGQWLIQIRSKEKNPITIIRKGSDGSSDFQISGDGSGNLDYTLVNQLISEPGHRKYVKYNGGESYTLTLDVTGNAQISQKNKNPVSVLFVVNTSPTMGSTQAENGHGSTYHTYMYYAQNAMKQLAEKILSEDTRNQIAIVDSVASHWTFGTGETAYNDAWVHQTWTGNQETAVDAINSLKVKTNKYWIDGTYYDDLSYQANWEAGFRTGKELFDGTLGTPNTGNDTVVILLANGRTEAHYADPDRFPNYYAEATKGITWSNNQWDEVGTRAYLDFALPELKELLDLAGAKFDMVSVYAGGEGNLVGQGGATNEQYTSMNGSARMIVRDITNAGYDATLYRGYVVGTNNTSYNVDGLGGFLSSFDGYESSLFTQSNVVVTDSLSEYADLLNEGEFTYTLKAYNADGTEAEVPDGTKAEWNEETKKITWTFPEGFSLADGVTYQLSFDIKPTQKAYSDYSKSGYNATGDLGTDAQGNETSSGKPGFYSNMSAQVKYDFAFTTNLTADYRRPVIQIPTVQTEILKIDKDTQEPLRGVTFTLYQKTGETAEPLAPGDGWREIDSYETDKAGRLDLGNLASGEYRLMENSALENYKNPEVQWKITVDAETVNEQDRLRIVEVRQDGSESEAPEYLTYDQESGQWIIQNRKLVSAEVSFVKYDAEEKNKFLNGVEFKLYSCSNTQPGHEHEELASDKSEEMGCWTPIQENGQDKIYASAYSSATGFDGLVDFGALQEGEYMLVETKTLAGYELPKGQWLLTVSRGSNGYGSYSFLVKGDETTPEFGWRTDVGTGIIAMGLPNEKKATLPLPGAGGPGVTALYLTGFVLLAGTGGTFLYKRKKKARSATSG